MKGKRVRIGCAAASLLMGISGTYAYYRSSVETINKIAVGDVNIGIWEYEEDGMEKEEQLKSKVASMKEVRKNCELNTVPVRKNGTRVSSRSWMN